MASTPFKLVPEFSKDTVTTAESAPSASDFVDLGDGGRVRRTEPYDGTWDGRRAILPGLDHNFFSYIRFAFSVPELAGTPGAEAATVTVWELTPEEVIVAVAQAELGADLTFPTVLLERRVGSAYAVTVSSLTLDDATSISFDVLVAGEHQPAFVRLGVNG